MSNPLKKKNTSAIIDTDIIPLPFLAQLEAVIREGKRLRYSTIEIRISNGKLDLLVGPTPSQRIKFE